MMNIRLYVVVGLSLTVGLLPIGQERSARSDEPEIDYRRDIRPILSDNCYKCHGPDEAVLQADLRLDRKRNAFQQRGSGRPITAGRPDESTVYQRISASDPDEKMPPSDSGKVLTAQEIARIKRWIEEGAEWREHWSFLRAERPPLPASELADEGLSPIDQFIRIRLEQAGLSPSPRATKQSLIRRVTLDLTGLPPTLPEIDAFLADDSPAAYERMVDRLLKSARYGEHRARYWLDAARYGDTHGLHLDNERSMWPYRDWVIKAFNDNKPFNEFPVEQLAGDLLDNPTLDQLVATGFNRCNVTTSEGGSIAEEYLVRYAVDRVETTSTVWLGLTTGCAVCHEHKFDPISQREFYQLSAYFFSLTEKAMDGNALLPPPTIKVPTSAQLQRQDQLNERIEILEEQIAAEVACISYEEPAKKRSVTETTPQGGETYESLLAWETVQRGLTDDSIPKYVRDVIQQGSDRSVDQQKQLERYFVEHVYSGTREIFDPLHEQLDAAQKELATLDKSIPATLIMQDLPQPRPAYVLTRGEYDKKGDQVEAGVPAVLPPLPANAPANRLALARWLVDRDHPLTARVTVNRLWQQFFGTGIVKTSEDFGSQGEWPSHPQLVDWLAVEFMERGWDVRGIVKQIVMSHAYCQSSRVTPMLLEVDPENRLLARAPRFRMDAEMIRDNALAISGLLVEQIGGQSVRPYQPSGIWSAVGYEASNTVKFVQDHGDKLYRRSMYTFWKRTAPPPTMQIFDAPSREYCVVRRERTNTPKAALALLNDVQFVEAARHLAQRMMHEAGDSDTERITFAFRLATARRPDEEEIGVLLDTYRTLLDGYQRDPNAATALIGYGEIPGDDTLDPVQLAAWTMVASAILNLDETITKG